MRHGDRTQQRSRPTAWKLDYYIRVNLKWNKYEVTRVCNYVPVCIAYRCTCTVRGKKIEPLLHFQIT